MPNLAQRFAEAVSQDGEGIEWTNATGGALDAEDISKADADLEDGTGRFAKVVLDAEEESKWLILTGFGFDDYVDPVPGSQDVTIEGVQARLTCLQLDDGAPADVVYAEVRLVVDGEIQGDDRANDRPVRRGEVNQSAEELFGTLNASGRPNDVWGLELTEASIRGLHFGVAIRVRNNSGSEVAVGLDTAQLAVYWQMEFQAIISHNGDTGMAPHFFFADATRSYVGEHLLEECEARWTVEGPAGWVMKAVDARSGTAEDRRDCATEAVSWGMGWVFDVAGSYSILLTLVAPDGTTTDDRLEVEIAADSRTHYFVKNGGNDNNDGLSDSTAWATLKRALAGNPGQPAPTEDAIIHLRDDETFQTDEEVGMSHRSNIVVTRYPGTGNRPVLSFATETVGIGLGQNNDRIMFRELAIANHDDHAFKLTNVDQHNLCWTNISFEDLYQFCENESTGCSNVLFHNCHGGTTERYFYYGTQHARNVVFLGYHGGRNSEGLANGHVRLVGRRENSHFAVGGYMLWCHCTTNLAGVSAFRGYYAYCGLFQCRFDECGMGFDQQESEGPHATATYSGRIDGLEITGADAFMTGRHAFMCNSRLIAPTAAAAALIWSEYPTSRALCEQVQIKNCTISTGVISTIGLFKIAHPIVGRENQLLLVNNAIVFDVTGTQNSDRFFSDQSNEVGSAASVRIIRASRTNVWPGENEPPRFTLYVGVSEDFSYDLWAEQPFCENENSEACSSSDFPANYAYLPDSSLTIVRSAGLPTGGVHRDFRGVPRDPQAQSWFAGCTSDDS